MASGSGVPSIDRLVTIYISKSEERFEELVGSPEGQFLKAGSRVLQKLQAVCYPTLIMDEESQRPVIAEAHLKFMFAPKLWAHHFTQPASVGTAVSHYNAWHQAECNGKKAWALILEEDVRFTGLFTQGLEQVMKWVDQGRAMQLVHLASSTEQRFVEHIQKSSVLARETRPPVELRTFPHYTKGDGWHAIHVAAGFKAYLISPALRKEVLGHGFQWTMRAVELDFINKVWRMDARRFLLELEQTNPERAYQHRVTILQPSLADHTVDWSAFFRGSGRMATDAQHVPGPYIHVWCDESGPLETRLHQVAIGLELAAGLQIGFALTWNAGDKCPLAFQDALAIPAETARSKGIQWIRYLSNDESASRAYWNSDQRVPLSIPTGVHYESFLAAWNTWGVQSAEHKGWPWVILPSSARHMVRAQPWAHDEKDALISELGLSVEEHKQLVCLLPPGPLDKAAPAARKPADVPAPWRGGEQATRKRVREIDLTAELWERCCRYLDAGRPVYIMAESEAELVMLRDYVMSWPDWHLRLLLAPQAKARLMELCHMERRQQARVRAEGKAGRGPFRADTTLRAAHLGMVWSEHTESWHGSDWTHWMMSLHRDPDVRTTTDDRLSFPGYGPQDCYEDMPRVFPPSQTRYRGGPMPEEWNKLHSFIIEDHALATWHAYIRGAEQRFDKVSARGLQILSSLQLDQRRQAEQFLNQMWQESTSLLRRQGLLVSSVAQRMEARFDFLASNRKRYMALDPASKGEWGWFTALVYVILNYVRQERRLKTFWTTTQTVPGSDRLILRAFASAEEAGKSRAGLR